MDRSKGLSKEYERDESFRDSIGTIDQEGRRKWIFSQKPKGPFYDKRKLVSYAYLLLFFTIPFIKFQGEPLLQLNILERKFIIFGLIFWPQDLFLAALALLTFMVFIVLFTVVFGRLFCGWVCPQTIFMEMVFRRIEYWIEGDANQQRKLAKQEWNKEKILKKGSKLIVFFILSFVIGNFFYSYIIGMDKLIAIVTGSIDENIGGFIGMLAFAGVFFFVYSYFREQVCLVVCPYGRLQSVLLDRNSIVVAYDYVRGEPRHHFKKSEPNEAAGDCVDCGACVRVCPTGIDIRNGTQLECVNCTACIDACNHIMEDVGREKGLIRYASENAIAKGYKMVLSQRIVAYSIVLLLLFTGLIYGISIRSSTETTILRAPGLLFQKVGNDSLSNLYNYKIVNKTRESMNLHLELEDIAGKIKPIGQNQTINLPSNGLAEGSFFLVIPSNASTKRKTKIKFRVMNGHEIIETYTSAFIGPIR
jgi:cytochrome c oxidase accessory protein FixG